MSKVNLIRLLCAIMMYLKCAFIYSQGHFQTGKVDLNIVNKFNLSKIVYIMI